MPASTRLPALTAPVPTDRGFSSGFIPSRGDGVVQLDPSLANKMRPHQREAAEKLIVWLSGGSRTKEAAAVGAVAGVASTDTDTGTGTGVDGSDSDDSDDFLEMFDHVADSESGSTTSRPQYQGAILADDMGLGKTLTAIGVLWSFLRSFQKKGVVVVPASIVQNWTYEIKRWLSVRLKTLVLKTSKDLEVLQAFKSGHPSQTPVLIVSYELFRTHIDELNSVTQLDIIVLDEGHKFLKNAGTKTSAALAACRATKRLVLTGTPLQNNLDELHSVVSFVAPPSLLGALSSFRSQYEHTITAGFKKGASRYAMEQAHKTARALSRKLSTIMIRRTADEVEGGRVEGRTRVDAVLQLAMDTNQRQHYDTLARACLSTFTSGKHVLDGYRSDEADFDSDQENRVAQTLNAGQVLPTIQKLRNICNCVPEADADPDLPMLERSVKLRLLDAFLTILRHKSPREKVVVVSNFTSALTVVQGLADNRGWLALRLDGSVPKDKRQALIDRFNRSEDRSFLFLLSSKAGGMGINLIGASRLIMLDVDWNPASDWQAMARIFRQGQTRDCFIYRLFASDSIEQSILSRQKTKRSLQAVMRDDGTGAATGAAMAGMAMGNGQSGLPKNLTPSILDDLFYPQRQIGPSASAAAAAAAHGHDHGFGEPSRLDPIMESALDLVRGCVEGTYVQGRESKQDVATAKSERAVGDQGVQGKGTGTDMEDEEKEEEEEEEEEEFEAFEPVEEVSLKRQVVVGVVADDSSEEAEAEFE
jgi:SNF2 family DNA or RNA helicase